MSLSAVKAEYMNYLRDKPQDELRNELMEIQYRSDYSDDSSINMIFMLWGLVPCLVSLIPLWINVDRLSSELRHNLFVLFIFVNMILCTMAALLNTVKSVYSRKNHDRNQFEQFKRECIEEVLGRTTPGGTHYIKKVSHRILIFQVLCCFLLILLLFCHMALEACFHIFGVKRFNDTNAVVVDVDNLIPLAVKIPGS